MGQDARRHAPATERNREPLAAVLAQELPASGAVLEVASGSGEHAVFFAGRFPDLSWQPSDRVETALESIEAWRVSYSGQNLCKPIELDAALSHWPAGPFDAILCVNMVHISPWHATEGLFRHAGQLLAAGAPLILYGPYLESDVETAPSNLAFDESLKSRDPQWGIRDIEEVDALAKSNGFERSARHAMPANNLTLVYRRN